MYTRSTLIKSILDKFVLNEIFNLIVEYDCKILGNCMTLCYDNFYGLYNNIYCFDIFPDGRIVSGGDGGKVKIWNTKAYQLNNCESCTLSHIGNYPTVNCIKILPDKRIF